MTQQKDFQILKDLYRLLKEGVDDCWWTESYENFEALNRLRIFANLEEIPRKKLEEMRSFDLYD